MHAVGHKISRGKSQELSTTDLQQTQVQLQESNEPHVNDMKLMVHCFEPSVQRQLQYANNVYNVCV